MAPQALVVGHEDAPGNGATFILQPVVMGANQVPLPVGDPHPMTCGPFQCGPGIMGPEITIEDSDKCNDWDPTLHLDVGLIDNSLNEHEGAAVVAAANDDPRVAAVTVFDGLDLGWTYSSSLDVTITHDLSVTSAESDAGDTSMEESLAMTSIGEITIGAEADGTQDQTYYALSAEPDETITGDDGTNLGSCQPLNDPDNVENWDYNDNLASRISKPDNCFRLTVDHGLDRNYLDAYSVTMDPKGADVSWGSIPWWMDQDELTCPSTSWEASEMVDVCGMFEAEVDNLPTPDAIPVVSTNTTPTNVSGPTLAGFKLHFADAAADRHQFTSMWYGRDDADGDAEMPPPNLYSDMPVGGTDPTVVTHVKDFAVGPALSTDDAANFTFVAPTDAANGFEILAAPWVWTVDDDFDPIYGDLGKVDTEGNDNPENYADNDDSNTCTADDGGTKASKGVTDGTLCDAEQTIETTVSFPLGLGYGCDAVEKTYTLTCTWSTRGQGSNVVGTPPENLTADNVGMFVECEVE